MFGIEKIISKPLLKWISKGKDDYSRAKIVMGSYFIIHLISVGLMSWMLYRLLVQKKKDKWSLITFISGSAISLVIPYKFGDWFVDLLAGFLSKVGKFTQFLAFIGLVMGIVGIILYFFDVKFTKKEEEKKDEDKEESGYKLA